MADTKIESKSKRGKYTRTPEIKEKNRMASMGHPGYPPFNKSPISKKQRKKASKFMKTWHQNHQHPLLGKKHSDETKMKMSQNRKGCKNGNWKGGITLSVRTFRKSKQYQQWRKTIFERDDYICQDCGYKQSLIVHHILSVKTHPELRLKVDNGISLCGFCHKERHKKNVA